MRALRSIRVQQMLWHGLLLAVVLIGFGFTTWNARRASDLRVIDQQLDRRFASIIRVVRPGPGLPPPPQAEGRIPSPTNAGLKEIISSLGLPGGGPDNDFYAVAWLPDGRELARSASAPADVPRPLKSRDMRSERSRGTLREIVHVTPLGEVVLVGKDINPSLLANRHFAWSLAGVGGLVLLFGLAGGWWISSRTLRPIADISMVATRIAHGDLSQRIAARSTGTELDQLVGVLNDTFARLDAAFTRQYQFTADAAHELRTPITVMLTHLQNGLSSECPNEEHRQAFEAGQRAAQRMRRLTESLLALARIDSGGSTADRGPCDLGRIVTDTIAHLRPLAESQGIQLDSDLGSAWCHGHPEQLGQVVSNLITNAIHYNRPDGSVEVKVATVSGTAILLVSDTGQGIGSEDLPHIFERFFRVDKARSHTAGRTGLGLAICQALVTAHGGTLTVTSALGHGSRFTVRLPTLLEHP